MHVVEHKTFRHSALFRLLPDRTAVTELQRRTIGLAPEKTAHIRCVLEIQQVGDFGDGQPRIDKVTFHLDKQLLFNQCFRRHARKRGGIPYSDNPALYSTLSHKKRPTFPGPRALSAATIAA